MSSSLPAWFQDVAAKSEEFLESLPYDQMPASYKRDREIYLEDQFAQTIEDEQKMIEEYEA
jgi:uncharacterized protein YqkB